MPLQFLFVSLVWYLCLHSFIFKLLFIVLTVFLINSIYIPLTIFLINRIYITLTQRDWFQDLPQTPKPMDVQLPYIKWGSICVKPMYILPYTLNHL